MLWFQSLKLRRNSLLLSQLPWLSLPPVFSRSLEGIKIHAGRLSMFANIWKPWRAKHNVTSVDNIYHATPVSMLIMNDPELNQTSLSLNACDLCVLCLSTFARSNSRLQLLPSPFDKNFRIAFSILPSPAFCLSQTSAAEHGNTWQYLRYNMLQNLPHLCRQWTRRQLLQPPLMSHHYRTVLPSAEGLTSPELQNDVHRKYAMSKMRDSGGPLLWTLSTSRWSLKVKGCIGSGWSLITITKLRWMNACKKTSQHVFALVIL